MDWRRNRVVGVMQCRGGLLDWRARRMWRCSQSGFTLIELIVVLASLGLVQYRNSIVRSQEAVLKKDLFEMRDAIDQYYADKNVYPATLDALVSDGYLRRMPKDPFTNSADSWV